MMVYFIPFILIYFCSYFLSKNSGPLFGDASLTSSPTRDLEIIPDTENRVYIVTTSNNTIVTVTDCNGIVYNTFLFCNLSL